MNLVEAFLAQVAARPDAVAIIAPDGRVVSYAELALASNTRARAYRAAGIGAGDVVLIARGVSVELYETLEAETELATGFTSHSYFAQSYRLLFGRPPSEERRTTY